MADFKLAYTRVMTHEGGWNHVPADSGGETYCGIARNYHPQWHGWAILDAIKNKKHGQVFEDPLLKSHVKKFYQDEFWNKMHGDLIQSQRVAEFIFDWFVNSGAIALKEVQKALGVVRDGKIGPKSLAAINGQDSCVFLNRLIEARLSFVANIVHRNPTQAKFLRGWINRINSFK